MALLQIIGRGGNVSFKLDRWFADNPKAAALARRNAADGVSTRQIIDLLRRTCAYPGSDHTSLLRWLKAPEVPAVDPKVLIVERQTAKKADEQKKRNEALIKELEHRLITAETANSFLLGVTGENRPQPKPIAPLKKRTVLPQATYVMAASDWHLEERVRPEMVGFRNEYNPEIAQDRAERFFRSNLVMLNAARAAWSIDQIVFWIGGDIITGWIHEENESENFLSPSEATRMALDVMTRGIQFMLEHYDAERILIPTSSGNHGRVLKKKRISSDFRTSWEFLMYQLLADRFKDEPRVEFQLGYGYRNLVDVYGLRISFHHGDGIRSGGGIGGIAPALYRRIYRENSQRGDHQWDFDVFGHYHQKGFPPRVAQNGSLIGWNAFAEFIGAAPEPPMQISFVIDSKHKEPSAFNPIFVSKVGK
jgi:hypothetical protein